MFTVSLAGTLAKRRRENSERQRQASQAGSYSGRPVGSILGSETGPRKALLRFARRMSSEATRPFGCKFAGLPLDRYQQQEVGEPRSGNGVFHRLLQLLPPSRHTQDDASAEGRIEDGDMELRSLVARSKWGIIFSAGLDGVITRLARPTENVIYLAVSLGGRIQPEVFAMVQAVDGQRVRDAVFESLRLANEQAIHSSGGTMETRNILNRAANSLCTRIPHGPEEHAIKKAVAAFVNDLFRGGIVSFGDPKNITQQGGVPHFSNNCFLTNEGVELFNQLGRDPLNREGYLAYLDQQAKIDGATRGYLEEALSTYRACCYKATAVMVGASVENLILLLRDDLENGLRKRGSDLVDKLGNRSIKTVTEGVYETIIPELRSEARRDEELRKLKEETESRMLPIAADFRRLRNDAGHPMSLEPITQADVHSNLLQFPATAKLVMNLRGWVVAHYI